MVLAPILAMGIAAVQQETAAARAKTRLEIDIQMVDEAYGTSLVLGSIHMPARSVTDWIDRTAAGLAAVVPPVLSVSRPGPASRIESLAKSRLGLPLDVLGATALSGLKLWAVRLLALAGALPLFSVLALAGLSEGLVRRDIRRWSAGRESAFAYHFAKIVLVPAAGWSCSVLLCLPLSVSLQAWLIGTGLTLCAGVAMMSSRFRKYL